MSVGYGITRACMIYDIILYDIILYYIILRSIILYYTRSIILCYII